MLVGANMETCRILDFVRSGIEASRAYPMVLSARSWCPVMLSLLAVKEFDLYTYIETSSESTMNVEIVPRKRL